MPIRSSGNVQLLVTGQESAFFVRRCGVGIGRISCSPQSHQTTRAGDPALREWTMR